MKAEQRFWCAWIAFMVFMVSVMDSGAYRCFLAAMCVWGLLNFSTTFQNLKGKDA